MASQVRAMLTKLFGTPEYRILILGLDGSGKTTILYKLKLNENVQTIPTIGFNVETITYNKTTMTIWDVGGCDKIRPLIHHYFENTRALIFVIDSQDSGRLGEAKEELRRLFELIDVPILIYLSKIDKHNGLQPDYVIKELKLNEITHRKWFFQPCSARTDDGLYDGLNWLTGAIKSSHTYPSKPIISDHSSTSINIADSNSLEDKFLQWLSQVDDDTIEEFIEKFEKHQLNVQSFDHRSLLRAIWSYFKLYGRKKTVNGVFDNIKVYISDMNETLMYFWIQIVHYAIETTKNPTNDFMGFLLMNPQLLNETQLPLNYYKRDTLFSNQAKVTIVLPDVKELPNILPSASSTANYKMKDSLADKSVYELNDDDFLKEFESCTLTNWSHKAHLRMAWLYLTRHHRRVAVNKIFDGIKNFIQTSQIARKTTFHFTMTYFWIQMIDLAIAQSGKDIHFEEFLILHPHLMNGGLFLEYYKKETLLDNPIARQEMVLPDIKPLPTTVTVNSKK